MNQRENVPPAEVERVLGTQQWYDLVYRPKLSCYRFVYNFIQSGRSPVVAPPFQEVLAEIALGLVLGVYWKCDLTRLFVPFLSAADASTSFGFGISTTQFSEDLLWAVVRWSETQGAYVVLESEGPVGNRLGPCLELDLRMADFKDVMSVRFKNSAHIKTLESQAFVLWLKWLLRSRRYHSHRAVILIDSAVVVGAASKGRTSSSLRRCIRRFAALSLAGNVQAYIILLPSSHNPSDGASRGVRRELRPACPPSPPMVSRATSLDGTSDDASVHTTSENDDIEEDGAPRLVAAP